MRQIFIESFYYEQEEPEGMGTFDQDEESHEETLEESIARRKLMDEIYDYYETKKI